MAPQLQKQSTPKQNKTSQAQAQNGTPRHGVRARRVTHGRTRPVPHAVASRWAQVARARARARRDVGKFFPSSRMPLPAALRSLPPSRHAYRIRTKRRKILVLIARGGAGPHFALTFSVRSCFRPHWPAEVGVVTGLGTAREDGSAAEMDFFFFLRICGNGLDLPARETERKAGNGENRRTNPTRKSRGLERNGENRRTARGRPCRILLLSVVAPDFEQIRYLRLKQIVHLPNLTRSVECRHKLWT